MGGIPAFGDAVAVVAGKLILVASRFSTITIRLVRSIATIVDSVAHEVDEHTLVILLAPANNRKVTSLRRHESI